MSQPDAAKRQEYEALEAEMLRVTEEANELQARVVELTKIARLGAHYENVLTRIASHDLATDYADVELRSLARHALKEPEEPDPIVDARPSAMRDAAKLHDDVIGPFNWNGTEFTTDHGELHSIDGTSTDGFIEADIEAVLYQGSTGDEWDGDCAAVVRLKDGRLAAWETWWGPTGHGFGEDAYGGDGEVWFAKPENLPKLVLQALTDKGRALVGIPREGLPK